MCAGIHFPGAENRKGDRNRDSERKREKGSLNRERERERALTMNLCEGSLREK